MDEQEYTQTIAEVLDDVHPVLRREPNAYKRAVIRMAIEEYMRREHEVLADALERHG